ncbi:MAG TPA: hypothetical protein VFA03_06450 [Acetobacteraceae bacterium]|nr:hypothetical protein [Acetobacteraceae bacterium]
MSATNFVWRPSRARRVTIDSFVPVPRGSNAVAPPFLNWATKDPSDNLDYEFDITPAVVGNDGDAIASINVTVSPDGPGDLLLGNVFLDGCVAVMWFSEGQAGTVYTVTVAVTTKTGRTVQRSVLLPVLSLSQNAIPATAIVTGTGAVITDQNGNPIVTS